MDARRPAGGESGEARGPGRDAVWLQPGFLFLRANALSLLQIRPNQFGGTGLRFAFSSPTASKEACMLKSPSLSGSGVQCSRLPQLRELQAPGVKWGADRR